MVEESPSWCAFCEGLPTGLLEAYQAMTKQKNYEEPYSAHEDIENSISNLEKMYPGISNLQVFPYGQNSSFS